MAPELPRQPISSNSSNFTRTLWRNHYQYDSNNILGRVVTGDYDGDGYDDIAAFYNYGSQDDKIHVFLSTGSSFSYEGNSGWQNLSQYDINNITNRVVSGDFNGDGYDDIAAFYDYYTGNDKMHVFLSTGSSFSYQGNNGWWNPSQYNSQSVTSKMVVGNFNGDGYDDIAMVYDYYSGNDKVHVLLSTGSSFSYQGNSGWYDLGTIGGNLNNRLTAGEFNGKTDYDEIAFLYPRGSYNADLYVITKNGTNFDTDFIRWESTAGDYIGYPDIWFSCNACEEQNFFGKVVSGRWVYNTTQIGVTDQVGFFISENGSSYDEIKPSFYMPRDDYNSYSYGANWYDGLKFLKQSLSLGYDYYQSVDQISNKIISGDFDGDNNDEIGYITQDGNYMKIWIYNN